jgi:hypothetical protein
VFSFAATAIAGFILFVAIFALNIAITSLVALLSAFNGDMVQAAHEISAS